MPKHLPQKKKIVTPEFVYFVHHWDFEMDKRLAIQLMTLINP